MEKEDRRWALDGITSDFLISKANWLREQRHLHDRSFMFFDLSGKLISFSRYDYHFASLAFFQAIIGLEKELKHYYESETDYLAFLFQKAVSEGILTDSIFQNAKPLSKQWKQEIKAIVKPMPSTHVQCLSVLIPKLRNQFVHGTYLLNSDFLHLTFELREMADVLSFSNLSKS